MGDKHIMHVSHKNDSVGDKPITHANHKNNSENATQSLPLVTENTCNIQSAKAKQDSTNGGTANCQGYENM